MTVLGPDAWRAQANEDAELIGHTSAVEADLVWRLNEEFRALAVGAVARAMREDNWRESTIAHMERQAMDLPNEYWGELREGRMPRDDM